MINRQKSMWNLAELKKFDPKYSGPSNGLPFFFCRDFLSLFFFIYLRVIIRSFVSFCSVIKGFFFLRNSSESLFSFCVKNAYDNLLCLARNLSPFQKSRVYYFFFFYNFFITIYSFIFRIYF